MAGVKDVKDAIADIKADVLGLEHDPTAPRAAASVDGDVAADVNDGSEWSFFSLHHTSVGISFGAVAFFLVALFTVYACFKTYCCGMFNCCTLCKPRTGGLSYGQRPGIDKASRKQAEKREQARTFGQQAMLPIGYDPYEEVVRGTPPSVASSAYGVTFGVPPPLPYRRPPVDQAIDFSPPAVEYHSPPSRPRIAGPYTGSNEPEVVFHAGGRHRDRSPSGVSRIFLSAKADAARYARSSGHRNSTLQSRFEELPN